MRTAAMGVLLAATGAFATDVFSPGPLARAHANLEGVQNCSQCHPTGEKLSAESCNACHVEIKQSIGTQRGLHGNLSAALKESCWSCHHEHKGVDFQLVPWGTAGPRGFDHKRTGWTLLGKHAETECTSCHQKKRISLAPILAMLAKQPKRTTYMGLTVACSSCHFDEHRGQEDKQCQKCHDERGFKSAPKFNHDKDSEYPLLGRHKKVECTGCHPSVTDNSTPLNAFPAPQSSRYLKFQPLAHAQCTACHEDVHQGKFGPKCDKCHSVTGWHDIKNSTGEREFHQKTRFPLEGAHLDAPCAGCHGPWPGQPQKLKGLAFGKCTDCHADAHEGQIAMSDKGPTCDGCHTVETFKKPNYTLAQHAKTKYPLEGSHQVVGCDACHVDKPALQERVPRTVLADLKRKKRPELFSYAVFDFNKKLERCESCHQDEHQGQFADEKKSCTNCHQVAAWSALLFDHQKDSRFPLTGAHQKVACGSCHPSERISGEVVTRYKPLSTECANCHADAHAGQFKGQKCDTCHETAAFKPAPKFVHAPPFTEYVLDGQHEKVACGKCHQTVDVGNVKVARYVGLPTQCEGCHEDFHHGAFRGFSQ